MCIRDRAKDVRAFLGLTGYYRRFSPNYSETITPLLQLLQKGHKWKWEDKHQITFENIKDLFQNNLHLFHPNDEGTYVLQTDASDTAIGAVLCQRDTMGEHRVISYINRTLKGAEKNYFTSVSYTHLDVYKRQLQSLQNSG